MWRKRLGIVRGFARYLATIDPASEIPPTDLLPARQPRLAPYIYAPEEIVALMTAARSLTWPLRAATFETVIGLLASTGLRLREALALDRSDVDLDHGVLLVRGAKHEQAARSPAAHQYHAGRWSATPVSATVSAPTPPRRRSLSPARSRRLAKPVFWQTFPKLVAQAGLEGHGQRPRPRPHDLSHTFAVRTLLGWYRAGEDVDRKLPLLSTYLGHVEPESTYWYLQAVPELLALVSQRLDERLRRGCHDPARADPPGVLHRPADHPAQRQPSHDRRPTATRSGCCSRSLQQHTGKQPCQLDFDDLDAPLIGAFLTHLEHDRHNSARTRNNRLAAIHSPLPIRRASATPSTPRRSRG